MARNRLRFQPELVTAFGVLGLAIALRAWAAVTLFEPVAVWGGDARVYAEILAGLEQGKLIPEAWIWPPGYPLLGLVFRPFFDPGLSLLVVSFLAGIAVPALILLAGRAADLRTRATVAAFIVAVHPEAVMASGRPLSESSALLLTIASLIGVEAAVRTRRVLWGLGAGLLGGLAVLTRPEIVLSLAPFGLFVLAFPSGSRRPAWVAAAATWLVVAAYMLALHSASGAWTLSLKLPLNIQREIVYDGADTFEEARLRWEDFYQEHHFRDGELDPRRVIEAMDTSGYLLRPETAREYFRNVIRGVQRDPWPINLLWVCGILGLAFPGRRGRRERVIAALSAAPVLAVLILFMATERYAVIALAGLAWGTGTLFERLDGRLELNAAVRRAAVGVLAVALVAGGVMGAQRGMENAHWTGRRGEFRVAMARQDWAEAERFVRQGLLVDPDNPDVREAQGDVRARRSDPAGAVRAYLQAAERGADRIAIATKLNNLRNYDAMERVLAPLRPDPPDRVDYWTMEGNLATIREDWRTAADAFARAEEIGGPNPELALVRGMALAHLGLGPEARTHLQRAATSPDAAVRGEAQVWLRKLGGAAAP